MRQDNTGRTPNIGDKVAFNPPYYKGLLIGEVTGEKKGSGLPTIDVNGREYTPKTGFIIVEDTNIVERLMLDLEVLCDIVDRGDCVDEGDVKDVKKFLKKLKDKGYYSAPEWNLQTPEDKEKVKILSAL